MAELASLVSDIYKLFGDEPHKCSDERVKEFGQAVAETVARRLSEVRTGTPGTLRMSNIGRPARQLWYETHLPAGDGESISPQAKVKFLYGDLLELMLLFLAEEAGHSVTDRQAKVDVNGVKGSMDAVVDGVVVDVKSASSPAFKKFEYGTLPDNDGFGYMEQLAGYSRGHGLGTGAAFLAIDKQLGKIALLPFSEDELQAYRIPERIDYLREVLDQSDPPERCYSPVPEDNGNQRLGVGCSYCPFKFKCWSDANNGSGLRTFLYANGPKHLVHVESEPRVQEVTF